VAGAGLVGVLKGFAVVAVMDDLVGLFLENGDGIEQDHGGPEILANGIGRFAGKLFDAEFPL